MMGNSAGGRPTTFRQVSLASAGGLEPRGGVAERVIGHLRARGARITSAKRLLVSALLTNPAHRTAEQLAAAVQAQAPDVHLTTIYRNLDELERLGVIERTHTGHGPATCHLASTPHGHLACQACGSLTEVPATLFADLAESLRERYGFAVSTGQLALAGQCADCHRR